METVTLYEVTCLMDYYNEVYVHERDPLLKYGVAARLTALIDLLPGRYQNAMYGPLASAALEYICTYARQRGNVS